MSGLPVVVVRIPAALRAYVGGAGEVEVQGETVGAALQDLTARFPELRRHLYGDDGRLRSFVNIYLNEEDVRHLGGEGTAIRPGDALTIVPSIAGGAEAATREGATAALPGLSNEEVARYARHLVLPEVGLEGQRRLKAAKVLLVGAGGLGSPAALYLAAAGVGTLGLVDFDAVDASNLHRQVLYGVSDVGRPKLEAAAARIRDVNPNVEVVAHPVRLTSENALEVLEPYDVVVDGTDNFPTRYLVNDACVLLGKPNVYGSIYRFEGQVSVFGVPGGPCYRCLFREPPPPGLVPTCAEGGVLGVLPGIIGSLQALEALKLILGKGQTLAGRLLLFDGLTMRWRELRLRRNPACPVCGDQPTIRELIDYEEFCGVKREREEAGSMDDFEVTPTWVKTRLESGEPLRLIDVRERDEWELVNLGAYGAELLPLSEYADRYAEVIDAAQDVVVYCRSGNRSGRVVKQLRGAGYTRVWNLRGGIRGWAEELEPGMPRY
jgi:molybdopterin/thiamine biosynthesis adenylyltransferase/rhodanese-related sulfurtransferase/molybdopterin converting factor small subunit